MSAGPRRLSALPVSWLVDAPIVAPRLAPETLNGYCLPRNVSTPRPLPTPMMKPPLVNTTRTSPVSACDGDMKLADIASPSNTARSVPLRQIINFSLIEFGLAELQGHECRAACLCWWCSLLRRSLRCFIGVPIAARDRPHAPADVFVRLVGQVRERYAHRPVGRFKPAAVEQHDAVG